MRAKSPSKEAFAPFRIRVRPTDQLLLNVTSCDDQLYGIMDGFVFMTADFGQHQTLELMDLIRNSPGVHFLTIIGGNRAGGWSFGFNIDVNGNSVPGAKIHVIDKKGKPGIVKDWSFEIEVLP